VVTTNVGVLRWPFETSEDRNGLYLVEPDFEHQLCRPSGTGEDRNDAQGKFVRLRAFT
jgi:hypothetical protein